MNIADYANNMRTYVVKKYLFEMLQDRYGKNEPIIERIASMLPLEKDLEAFNKLMADVYEKAYHKCVADHKEQLAKLGFKVNIAQKDG